MSVLTVGPAGIVGDDECAAGIDAGGIRTRDPAVSVHGVTAAGATGAGAALRPAAGSTAQPHAAHASSRTAEDRAPLTRGISARVAGSAAHGTRDAGACPRR